MTQGDLLRAQAAAASAVALALLVRPRGDGWLAAAGLGLLSLLAVVGTTYVAVPALGPFPRIFEPAWYGEKVVAAVAAGAASGTSTAGFFLARRRVRGVRGAAGVDRLIGARA